MIENLELSQDIEYSLMGFLETFKNTIMYTDAKVKLIEILATTNTNLKPSYIVALYLWTYSPLIYKGVHDMIILNSLNKAWDAYIYTLYSAIINLQPFVGEVYRSIETTFTVDKFPLNSKIYWKTFSSSTTEWKHTLPFTLEKKGIIFIIQSKTGRYIAQYSKYPTYHEVIFLPNTKFLIKNYYKANICCLGQSNIRLTTYSMSLLDIEKATNGKTSIIIELEEC